jgi:hypothetical protein
MADGGIIKAKHAKLVLELFNGEEMTVEYSSVDSFEITNEFAEGRPTGSVTFSITGTIKRPELRPDVSGSFASCSIA